MKLVIIKETEKAVAVANLEFVEARETARRDIKELDERQRDVLTYGSDVVWLPKSQVTIEGEYVIDMPEWLAKRNGFVTEAMYEASVERYKAGCDRYNKALNFAKEHGLPVRNKMKLSTIMAEIKKAGLSFEG